MHRLELFQDRAGAVELPAAVRVLYVAEGSAVVDGTALAADEAWHGVGAVRLEPAAGAVVLRWELVPDAPASAGAVLSAAVDLDPGEAHLLRGDRVDFPPGGEAFLHTHQGPGVRCLLFGAFRVETGGQVHEVEPLGAWFEAGPEPVYAQAGDDGPAAFARVLVLPRRLLGQSSIRYVRDEDRERPKSQRYTVLVDASVDLP